MRSVIDLGFSDLCVAEKLEGCWYKPTPDSMMTNPVPEEYQKDVEGFRSALSKREHQNSFKIEWSGVELRVQCIPDRDGHTMYVCRRYKMDAKALVDLGVPERVSDHLMSEQLLDGFVVFLGRAGSGKTTTQASFLRERLVRHGGFCCTVENPIEIALQGRHGDGYCNQIEVSTDQDMGAAVTKLYRATPNIIGLGEVRESVSIREALIAANSGHLVVTTFHAGSLSTGLARMVRLAGDPEAAGMLADSLRVALHLGLYNQGAVPADKRIPNLHMKGTGKPPRVLTIEPLFLTDGFCQSLDGIRSMIREGEFHSLKSEIQRQTRMLMMGGLP